MASNKEEDIYETSDLPEVDQDLEREETFESEFIERVHLDVASAFERFKDRSLQADDVDFADWLSKKRRRGYGGGTYDLELIGADAGVTETAQQKFNRLHHEINELAEELKNVKTDAERDTKDQKAQDAVSVSDVVGLQSQLKTLQVEQILGQQATLNVLDPHGATLQKLNASLEQLKQAKPSEKSAKSGQGQSGQVTYELMMGSGPQPGATPKVPDLEARLAKLEKVLGCDMTKLGAISDGGDGQRVTSLTDAIELLNERVQMLDASHIDAVEARLNALMVKYKQVQEARKDEANTAEAEHVARVNQLHEMMTKWKPLCATLPDIVTRLHALQQLHEQAMQVSQAVTQLDVNEQQMKKSVDGNSTLLEDVKSSLSQNMDAIRGNMDSLDARVKALGGKN